MNHRPLVHDWRRLGTRVVDPLRPLDWLRRGWQDLWHCPGPALVHGVAVAGFGALLFGVAYERFWMLAGAFSGFLLVAPVVATGLYRISRDLALGHQPGVREALKAWRPDQLQMVGFGLLLALAGTGWVLTSAALITTFSELPVRSPAEFVRHVVLHPTSRLFEVWLVLGAVLAAPVFASSVVSMPLLMDRRVGVLAAVLTSWRVLMDNPITMVLWAFIILGLTAIGMLTALIGLAVVVPWLAHASWHAYVDLIDASAVDGRD